MKIFGGGHFATRLQMSTTIDKVSTVRTLIREKVDYK